MITRQPADWTRLASDVADFLTALRRVDSSEGPPPGAHCFHRGAHPEVYAEEVEAALAALGDKVDQDCDGVLDDGPDCPACVASGDVDGLFVCPRARSMDALRSDCSALGAARPHGDLGHGRAERPDRRRVPNHDDALDLRPFQGRARGLR